MWVPWLSLSLSTGITQAEQRCTQVRLGPNHPSIWSESRGSSSRDPEFPGRELKPQDSHSLGELLYLLWLNKWPGVREASASALGTAGSEKVPRISGDAGFPAESGCLCHTTHKHTGMHTQACTIHTCAHMHMHVHSCTLSMLPGRLPASACPVVFTWSDQQGAWHTAAMNGTAVFIITVTSL